MFERLKSLDNLTLKFMIVGGIGFVVNYLILFVASNRFGVHKVPAEVLAAAVALQITFVLHDNWTYLHPNEDSEHAPMKMRFINRYILYMASNALGALMTVILFSLFIRFTPYDLVALSGAAFIQLIWNYTFNKLVIWRRREA